MYGTAYLSLSSLPLLVNSFKMDCESQELRYDWEPEISGTGSRSRVDEFWVLRVILLHPLNNMGIEAVVELRGGRGGLPLKDVHGGPRETSGLRGYKGPVKQSIHDINISTDVDVFRSPETWLLGPRRGLRKFFSYLASLAIFCAPPINIIRLLHRSNSLTPITSAMLRYKAEHSLAFRICQSN